MHSILKISDFPYKNEKKIEIRYFQKNKYSNKSYIFLKIWYIAVSLWSANLFGPGIHQAPLSASLLN